MTSALTFAVEHSSGIVLLLFLLVVLCALLNWLLWMFGWGRFVRKASSESGLRFVLANFFVKLINDFRHMLALLIFVLFALALFAAMWPGMMKQDVTLIKQGLEGVAAALGGLIGSIMGYYFGESSARSRLPGGAGQQAPPSPAEQGDSQNSGEIMPPATKPNIS